MEDITRTDDENINAKSRVKQSRIVATRKGQLTKLINKVKSLILETNKEDEVKELRDVISDARDVVVDENFNLIECLTREERHEEAFEKEKEIETIDKRLEQVYDEIHEYLKRNKDVTVINDVSCHIDKMKVPRFSGHEYTKWKALFNVIIDSQPMSNQIKMLRLLSCLDGEAKELIKNYPPIPESYQPALSRLEHSYGGTKRLMSEAIRSVRVGRMIEEESVNEIRRFITTLESTSITMEKYDHEAELKDGGALFHCAKERLTRGLLRQYTKWTLDKEICESFKSLIRFLTEWLIVLESTSEASSKGQKFKPQMATYSQYIEDGRKETISSNNRTFHSFCPYHKKVMNETERHYIDTCPKFKALSVKERKDFVFGAKLCRLCLKPNHLAKNCTNIKGRCRKCTQTCFHHYLLHEDNYIRRQENTQTSNSNDSLESNTVQMPNQTISLQTVPIKISNGSRSIIVNALLDIGSSASFISKSIIDELHLKPFGAEAKTLNMINNNSQMVQVAKVKVLIESLNGNVKRTEILMTTGDMLLRSRPTDWTVTKYNWDHLKSVRFPRLAPREYHEVLIGSDLIYYHRSLNDIIGKRNSPIARKTPLGITAFGPVQPRPTLMHKDLQIHHCLTEDLNHLVKKHWDLESLGIREDASKSLVFSLEDQKTVDKLQQDLKYENKRYEAPVLWRNDLPDLKNNHRAVLARTNKMEERLMMKSPDIMKTYDEIIKTYESKDYIVRISEEEKVLEEGYFIPHFPVIREERATTKCRIVYDCASKSGANGSSLNDEICPGPKLQNDIIDVLIRYRRYAYAVVADISEMYLQIKVRPQDRKFCRFWWKGQAYQWQRCLFGRADCPFVALFIVQHHVKKYIKEFPDSVQSVLKSMYVDDLADSRDTPEEVELLVSEMIKMFQESSMEIRKWLCNSRKALISVPKALLAKEVNNLLDDSLPTTKLLGMSWDVENDRLFFGCSMLSEWDKVPWSKRLILKALARMYDPLGLLDPFTILARIIFQKVWVATSTWDEMVSAELKREWLLWYQQVQDIGKIRVPRHLGLQKGKEFTLHVFCDASQHAYSAVVYSRTKIKETVSVQLVVAKTRVSPLRGLTIPKMELMGATIAVRIAKKVSAVLEVDLKTVRFYSDSFNVLWWLKKPAKFFKPFVSNRVGEIQAVTDPGQWNYINTKMNPADIPTRGMTVDELKACERWWKGAHFLQLPESEWPKTKIDESCVKDKEERKFEVINVCTTDENQDFPLSPARWSDKNKLIKRVAYVCRFLKNTRRKKEHRILTPELQPEEWQESLLTMIRCCQQEAFTQEIKDIQTNGVVSKKSSILKLLPFVDEKGILRSKSRLQQVRWLTDDFRLPILLPKRHSLTKLIIKEVHEKVGHSVGIDATLAELAKCYWIVKARVAVKAVRKACSKCKITGAKAAQPQMAPLPSYRFSKPLQAFAIVGIDFCGPFETKAGRGKTRFKRYMAMFTCMQSRAVHLELVYSLGTDSFINAFMRMTCRRGVPRHILSDNGGTFIKSEKEIRKLMLKDTEKISSTCPKEIKWSFNPPYGSHFGGIFERCIRSAKRALYQILTKSDVNDEELMTAFCHVEELLNSRPLTSPSIDINDSMPLTPNNFLIGRMISSGTFFGIDKRESLHPSKRWKYLMALADGFWTRWQKEVLHEYKSRTKWATGEPNMKKDQVVMVLDPIKMKRGWRLGKIEEVYPGVDKIVRVVDVRYDGKVYRRPVTKLCPLEL